MDPARKRHFLQRWDRRQLFVRDRIREHLHDVAVDARIDWLHHRDLNNRSTLDDISADKTMAWPILLTLLKEKSLARSLIQKNIASLFLFIAK